MKARAEGPRKLLNLESLKCHFLDLRNLQFSSTNWAKACLINYILDKLQESMGNIFIILIIVSILKVHYSNDKGQHDLKKNYY